MPHLYEALDLKPEEADVVLKALTRYALIMGGATLCIDDENGIPWFRVNAEQLTAIACEVHRQLIMHIPQVEEGKLRNEWQNASRK